MDHPLTPNLPTSVAYKNVLAEFLASGVFSLRLLPVSGGIFAGPFLPKIPSPTAAALGLGLSSLGPAGRRALESRQLCMCVFNEAEAPGFEAAWAAAVAGEASDR